MDGKHMGNAGMNKRYVDNFFTAGKNADNIKGERNHKEICRKVLRAVILTAGGGLLVMLLIPVGFLFLSISFIWKITDYLLKKVDSR